MQKLELKPGQKVLDVGCGIGGGDFYMAENFDVEVVGIDLSINMISFALERAIGLNCSVEFEVADCTKKTYPENTFDVIYSRDTILHIQVSHFSLFFFFFHGQNGSRKLYLILEAIILYISRWVCRPFACYNEAHYGLLGYMWFETSVALVTLMIFKLANPTAYWLLQFHHPGVWLGVEPEN